MKAIIVEGDLKFQNSFKEFNGNVGLQYATGQQWYDWGFREYVVPTITENQIVGELYLDSVTDTITYYVINKTQEEIDADFSDRKKSLISKFERDTDSLIREIVGERAFEYELAETEAIAFKAAGYPDADVPASVSSDAIANGRTNQEACDLILLMADNWRTAQTALRANRLLVKAQAKNSLTIDELAIVDTKWVDFINLIKLQVIE